MYFFGWGGGPTTFNEGYCHEFGWRIILLYKDNLISSYATEEYDSASLSNLTACSLSCSPIHNTVLMEPVLCRSCIGGHCCYEFMESAMSYLEDSILYHPLALRFFLSPCAVMFVLLALEGLI